MCIGKLAVPPVSVHGVGGSPSEEHPCLDEDEVLTCLPVADYEQLNNCRSCDACAASPASASSSHGPGESEDEPEALNADIWEVQTPGIDVNKGY